MTQCTDCAGPILDDAPAGLCPRCLMQLGLRSRHEISEVDGYELSSLIGKGGMGSVWLAHRNDGRFEGCAAIKLLNVNLLGRPGETRFTREGTILARLSHPSIARLLDAGVASSGQPYLVLEHVQGEHIDRYCDARRLGIDERVRLVVDVLDAVAHAHASLIVHRDIKPSNVLAASDGQVKLLDFGIAKLLEDEAEAAEASILTREGGWALTPLYAAPEQVSGGPITTATDVYSLGVLLYVLLTGQHPLADAQGPPAKVMRAIVETEPSRLSEAVTAKDAQGAYETTAGNRSTTPEKLRRALHGDLETIVAKALKKSPTERYATASAMADDLRRYLDHRPIGATPDTLAYRTRKFVRRNRVAVALASFAIIALVSGLAGTMTQARRAEAQRARADQEARAATERLEFALRELSRAEAINELNSFLLSDAAPSGKTFTTGELLARAEDIVDRQQGDTPENRVEMLVSIGRQYESQDEEGKARELLGKAYELSRPLADRAVRAKAASALAGAIAASGEFARAETLIAEALRELGDAPQFALHRVSALLRGSYVAREGGEVQAAIDRVLAAQRILKESAQGSQLLDLRVSMDLAESYRMAGRNRDAATAFEDALARLSALGRENTELAGTLLNNWALAVQLLGQPLEAERLFRRAIAIGAADEAEQSVSPILLNNLARTLLELGRLDEAEGYANRAYAGAVRARDEIVINQALAVRFGIHLERGDATSAAGVLAELEPRWKRMMPDGHIAFALAPMYKALIAMERGDEQAALAQADRALAMTEANAQSLDYLPGMLLRRATVSLRFNRSEQARADAERALALELKAGIQGATSSSIGRAHLLLGRALQACGRREDARAAAAEALKHLEPTLGADHARTRTARQIASE